jgi:hypothetical protein
MLQAVENFFEYLSIFCGKFFSKIATQKITAGGITDGLEYCNNSFHCSCTSSVDSGV